jgi:hypothetical protein
MVVLLINTAVTGTGWTMNAPVTAPEQPVAAHAQCGDAMEQMAGMADMASVPEAQGASQHPHSPASGCCTPGTCHCAPPSPTSDLAIVPTLAQLVRVALISVFEQGAIPAPDLTRLLRPPIA